MVTAKDGETALAWSRLGAIGWSIFPAVLLHFAHLLTSDGRPFRPWVQVLNYLPAPFILGFQFLATAGNEVSFVMTDWGLTPTYSGFMPGFLAFRFYYFAALIWSMFRVIRWGEASVLQRERRQARVIAWVGLFPFLVGLVADTILRHAFDPPFPSTPHLMAVTFVGAVTYATARYRMMALTSDRVANVVLENTQDVMLLLDANGRIIDVNRRLQVLTGFEKEELIGREGDPLSSSPMDADDFIDRVLRSVSGIHRGTLAARTRTGEEIPFSVTGTVIRDRFGDPLWILLVGHDDRTSRSLSSETSQRLLAQASLAAEKERLSVTLQSIGEGVLTTDVDNRIEMMNSFAEQLTGWTQAQAKGHLLGEVLHLIDERSGHALSDLSRKSSFRLRNRERDGGVILRSRSGTEVPVAYSAASIRDLADRRIGDVVVVRDISGLRRLEADLIRVGKMDSLGVLAGGIAHDFNNLLTAILGYVQLARMDCPGTGAVEDRLSQAEHACLRAQGLTRQLLTFSRGGAPIRKAVAVMPLVRSAISLASSGSGVRVETEVDPNVPPILADEGQIHQVLHNLVLNAVQAMPNGGVVHLRAESITLADPRDEGGTRIPSGEWVRFLIQDEGPGIPDEHLSRIFEPFFTTKASGSGLGLATVYSIVRRHEGSLAVRNREEVGAEFQVWLPVSDSPVVQEAVPMNGSAGLARRKRILIMDDQPLVLDVLNQMLGQLGCEVVLSTNGDEAIRLFMESLGNGKPFDAMILDYTIPGGMGGADTIRAIREHDTTVPAIISSGYANEAVLSDYHNYGFNGVLAKPYQLHHLQEVLESVLNSGQEPRDGDWPLQSRPNDDTPSQ
jgi:PAS domain S-box-containing protein